jgi:hypothetical protein
VSANLDRLPLNLDHRTFVSQKIDRAGRRVERRSWPAALFNQAATWL